MLVTRNFTTAHKAQDTQPTSSGPSDPPLLRLGVALPLFPCLHQNNLDSQPERNALG